MSILDNAFPTPPAEWIASQIVNVIWRTLIVMLGARLRRRREGQLPLDAVGRIRLTTLPTDTDILRHMNNGRYLSLFDLGRWDQTIRTGLADTFRERGWYAVVSSETITFRKSLSPWQRFDIETRWIGQDAKALYLEHRAVVDGEIYARAIIQGRILRRSGGSVPHDEFFDALDFSGELPAVDEWIHDWAAASRLPGSRQPAPSTWG